MRLRERAPLLAMGLLVVAGCGGKDRTPEGAVELFLRAAQEGDAAEVYRLLAPSTQRELQQKARLAHAQAAGRPVSPEHLLAVRPEIARPEVTRIHTVSIDGDRGSVEISNVRRAVRETLELERVGRHWRVHLPEPPQPPALAASRPAASQPAASLPAASRPSK